MTTKLPRCQDDEDWAGSPSEVLALLRRLLLNHSSLEPCHQSDTHGCDRRVVLAVFLDRALDGKVGALVDLSPVEDRGLECFVEHRYIKELWLGIVVVALSRRQSEAEDLAALAGGDDRAITPSLELGISGGPADELLKW